MFGFNNSRYADVTFYSTNTGMQTVRVPAQSRQGAEQIIKEQYGNVQVMRINMNV